MNLEPTQYIPSHHHEVLSLPPSEIEPKEEKTGTEVQLSILYILFYSKNQSNWYEGFFY